MTCLNPISQARVSCPLSNETAIPNTPKKCVSRGDRSQLLATRVKSGNLHKSQAYLKRRVKGTRGLWVSHVLTGWREKPESYFSLRDRLE
ncbi:hypothetical protein CDAR_264541 [Caerostris darwini]|uniref:Uncharacterized protein n=1 Tax=Caerostris darwini TaxID=1538125 RepID=A0AAV4NP58_9ARAC|nr:hypothetical protein CDAR_264541 [Caerostris darwini]